MIPKMIVVEVEQSIGLNAIYIRMIEIPCLGTLELRATQYTND